MGDKEGNLGTVGRFPKIERNADSRKNSDLKRRKMVRLWKNAVPRTHKRGKGKEQTTTGGGENSLIGGGGFCWARSSEF